jgi:hypothetical protein
VGDILKAAERAGGLARQLLAFSRKQVLQPRVSTSTRWWRTRRRCCGRLIGEDVMLVTVLGDRSGT